jgi:hypothetical protein
LYANTVFSFCSTRTQNERSNGFAITSYTKDLVAKMEFYANNGGKASGSRRRMAALTDIKQVLVPENVGKLKTAIQSIQQKTASIENLSPSVTKAMTKIQSTIQENETDLQFLQRFAALHLSAAINVPNKVMQDGMRRMREEVIRCGLDLNGLDEAEAEAAPATVDAAEDDISRLMDFIVKFLDDLSQGGERLRGGDLEQNDAAVAADSDTAVGAQQTRDEWVLLLFTVGIVIFAFLPQFLFTPIIAPLPVPIPPAVPAPGFAP